MLLLRTQYNNNKITPFFSNHSDILYLPAVCVGLVGSHLRPLSHFAADWIALVLLDMILLATDLSPPLHIAVEAALVLGQTIGHYPPLLQYEGGHGVVAFQSVAVVVAEEGVGVMDHHLDCNLMWMKCY